MGKPPLIRTAHEAPHLTMADALAKAMAAGGDPSGVIDLITLPERLRTILGPTVNRYQIRGLIRFVPLAAKIRRFDDVTTAWSAHGSTLRGKWNTNEREFDAPYWKAHVAPFITDSGEFTPERLTEFGNEIFETIRNLEGVDVPQHLSVDIPGCEQSYMAGFTYREDDIPLPWRADVADIVDRYLRSARWLFQANELECEGWGDCPWWNNEIQIGGSNMLRDIHPGPIRMQIKDLGGLCPTYF